MVRYALLLGSSTFDDENYNTLGCVKNDVNDFKKILLEYGEFEEDNIKVLLDEDFNYSREEIENFLSKVTRNDFILFYYSGHGELDRYSNRLYFILKNTKKSGLKATSCESQL